LLRERAKQQVLLFKGSKVLAVDPNQIHTALPGASTHGTLGTQALHHLGGIADFDVHQFHTVPTSQLLPGPLNVTVDDLTTGPGIEVNRLPTSLINPRLPIGRGPGPRRSPRQTGHRTNKRPPLNFHFSITCREDDDFTPSQRSNGAKPWPRGDDAIIF